MLVDDILTLRSAKISDGWRNMQIVISKSNGVFARVIIPAAESCSRDKLKVSQLNRGERCCS